MNEVTTNSNMQLSEHLALPSEATLGYSNELDSPRLSPHFLLGEFTKSNESKQDYDELFIEKNKYGRYWVHFAVRPQENRRKIGFLNG